MGKKESGGEACRTGPGAGSCPTCELRTEPIEGAKQIDPTMLANQFVRYCLTQGWVITRRVGKVTKHYVTEEGARALKRFEIEL